MPVEIANALLANVYGVMLVPVMLATAGFAFGIFSARFRWSGWRIISGLVWLAAAITAEVLLVQAIFLKIDFSRIAVLLLGGIALVPLSVLIVVIERTITARHLGTTPATSTPSPTESSQPRRMPSAWLGLVIGLLVAISSMLLPVITEPAPAATSPLVPTILPTITAIPTITPVMPPTNTPHPTFPATSTSLPTFTITPSETDIPTLIPPPTIIPTMTITPTPSITPRVVPHTALPSRTYVPPPHQPASQ